MLSEEDQNTKDATQVYSSVKRFLYDIVQQYNDNK